MKSFSGKVVWITGASSGIGEALAYAFAKEKAKLVLSARREDVLKEVKRKCQLEDEAILILPIDLSDTSQIEKATMQVIQHFGSIDLLINNGGISQRSFVKETPLEIDRKIMEVNFFSAVAITKSVLPQMLKQQSGHVVVISSISGKFGFFLRSAYCASKHALQGFFESLRLEMLEDHIKVTIVCPGKIQSNISLNALTKEGKNNNIMDESQQNGVPSEECARQILKAIRHEKEEVFIGGSELRAVWIKRFFPGLFTKLIRNVKHT